MICICGKSTLVGFFCLWASPFKADLTLPSSLSSSTLPSLTSLTPKHTRALSYQQASISPCQALEKDTLTPAPAPTAKQVSSTPPYNKPSLTETNRAITDALATTVLAPTPTAPAVVMLITIPTGNLLANKPSYISNSYANECQQRLLLLLQLERKHLLQQWQRWCVVYSSWTEIMGSSVPGLAS